MYNKNAMKELKGLLLKKYPDLIDRIILYGSRAKNRENDYSDYDLLLILKEHYDKKVEENILDIAYDIILKYDILTDLKFIEKDQLKGIQGSLPFIQSVINDGITI